MKITSCLAAFSASLLLASVAYAQEAGPDSGGAGGGKHGGGRAMAACKGDVQTYCKDVQPGGGRIINCLEDHYKEVSDDCYNVLQKMEARRSKNGGGDQRNDGAPPPPPGGQGGNGGDAPPPPEN